VTIWTEKFVEWHNKHSTNKIDHPDECDCILADAWSFAKGEEETATAVYLDLLRGRSIYGEEAD